MKTATFSIVVTVFSSVCVLRGERMPDWWEAQREVTATLIQQTTNLPALVNQVRGKEPLTAQEAMFRFCVLSRAGAERDATEALRDLKRLCPELDNHQVSGIYYTACDHSRAWDLAQAVVEIFAANISELSLESRLLKHFKEAGWTVDRIDQWFASKPRGVDNFWVKERLRFNVANGRGSELEAQLAERVRARPKEAAEAIAFLDALIYARTGDQKRPDLAWIAHTVHPSVATEASEIASRLVRLEDREAAIPFYQHAKETSLTDPEIRKLASTCAVARSDESIRAAFAAHTREGLADCLMNTGRAQEAQKWMLAAAQIRKENQLGDNALFAGLVQAASGQRVVEERIKAAERESASHPSYWRARAQYYRGRGESALEENAMTNGLAVAMPQPEPEPRHREYEDWRSSLVGDYALFLQRQKRGAEAAALLRKEIAEAPANSGSSVRAAYLLSFEFQNHIAADDQALWKWLDERPHWKYTEERLLWRMLEKTPRGDLDKNFVRAEKLADDADPTRARTLGWIQNRMGFAKRSIPLLEYAMDKAADPELKKDAAFTLFESCLDVGDWKRAEQMLPAATKSLTSEEFPSWYSRVAILAAKEGAKSDAMRIWRRIANMDLSATDPVDTLAGAGLRDELTAFYQEMEKAIPSSDIPGRVLAKLVKP